MTEIRKKNRKLQVTTECFQQRDEKFTATELPGHRLTATVTDKHKYHAFFCFTLRWKGALEHHYRIAWEFFLFFSLSQSKEKTERQLVSQNKQIKRHFYEKDTYILLSMQRSPCASKHNQMRGSRFSIHLAAPPHWKSISCCLLL